ncbi:MAG: (Na+)-NQR maturation NqrM [Pseudomonadales bacterium]|jgi:hypothetical protein
MTTILLAFLIMLLMVAGMAIGVLFGRKPISGSCGGMKALGMDTSCEVCGGNPDRCESNARNVRGRALFYRADD